MPLIFQRDPTWTSVNLTASFITTDGNAATGWVTFEPSKTVIYSNSVIVSPVTIVAPLLANGAFTVELPCTDDALLNTSDWYYIVTEHIPNGRPPYKIQVTNGGTSLVSPFTPSRTLESLTKVAL